MPGRATPPMPLNWPGAMVEQGVDQGVFFVAGGRMHHQPRRLVQHQQGFVLVEDVERHPLPGWASAGRASGQCTSTCSPARGACVGFTVRPLTRMWPSSINR